MTKRGLPEEPLTYSEALEALKSRKCPECAGTGKQDDASLYDTYYNTWTCTACKGTGFRKESKT